MKHSFRALFFWAAVGALSCGCSNQERDINTVEVAVEEALKSQDYRFMALLDNQIVYPEVPGMPDAFFRKGGVLFIQKINEEDKASDRSYMKAYNELLVKKLKEQNKLGPLLKGEIPPVPPKPAP